MSFPRKQQISNRQALLSHMKLLHPEAWTEEMQEELEKEQDAFAEYSKAEYWDEGDEYREERDE